MSAQFCPLRLRSLFQLSTCAGTNTATLLRDGSMRLQEPRCRIDMLSFALPVPVCCGYEVTPMKGARDCSVFLQPYTTLQVRVVDTSQSPSQRTRPTWAMRGLDDFCWQRRSTVAASSNWPAITSIVLHLQPGSSMHFQAAPRRQARNSPFASWKHPALSNGSEKSSLRTS